jgi:hypothetical protein
LPVILGYLLMRESYPGAFVSILEKSRNHKKPPATMQAMA